MYDITKLLVEAGADINISAPINGLTPLSAAAMSNDVEMMKLLVQCGAFIDRDDIKPGGHAMFNSINCSHASTTKALIEMGADINHSVMRVGHGAASFALTPVILAALMGRCKIVKVLHRQGADLNPCQIFTAHDVMFSEMPHTSSMLPFASCGFKPSISAC